MLIPRYLLTAVIRAARQVYAEPRLLITRYCRGWRYGRPRLATTERFAPRVVPKTWHDSCGRQRSIAVCAWMRVKSWQSDFDEIVLRKTVAHCTSSLCWYRRLQYVYVELNRSTVSWFCRPFDSEQSLDRSSNSWHFCFVLGFCLFLFVFICTLCIEHFMFVHIFLSLCRLQINDQLRRENFISTKL